MSEIFLKVVNMSISASWIVLAVLVLRLLFKKAPKWITVLLWGIVALRLICPFTMESVMSLIPSSETIHPEIMMERNPQIDSGVPMINSIVNPMIGASFTPDPATSANPLQLWIPTFAVIWLLGIAGMLLYSLISYIRVKNKVGTAILLRDNIYQSENVVSPFVLGLIRPKIYLPFRMDAGDPEHVIAHEAAHIRRKDHLWKPLGFLLLAIHWFNPLMWLGYVLLCRDIELACDEKVIKDLSAEQKADYSQALLTCSVNRRTIAACPLAFGELGVKARVKSVLHYKKPAFWVIVLALAVSVAVAVCFLTDPKKEPESGILSQKGGSDLKGITLEIVDADLSSPDPFLEVEWVNDVKSGIEFGEEFVVLYEQDGTWENCSATANPVWHLVAYYLEADSTVEHRRYKLNGQLMSMPGKYRLEVPFCLKGENKSTHKAWVEFELEKGVANVSPHTFEAEALVYTDGMYSFVQSAQDAPDFMLANGMQLFQITDGEISESLGIFVETVLDWEHFDSRFRFASNSWAGGESVATVKKNNHRIWQLYGDSADQTPHLYLLLKQKDGSFYLGEGYFQCNSTSPANADDSHIRWLYRLKESNSSIGGADAPAEISPLVKDPMVGALVLQVPTMVVVSNEQSIAAQRGTSTWTYTDENGKAVTVSADGTHPLNAKKTMPKIDILPSYLSYADPLGAYLGFNAEEFDPSVQIPPDEIRIRCWEEKDWGKSDAESEEVPLNVIEDTLFFTLKDGNYVYEVTATWKKDEGYGGTASYTFYTKKSDFDPSAYPKIGEGSRAVKTFLQTEAELVSETYEKGDYVISKTYHQMDDGLWVWQSYGYLYCLEVEGKGTGMEKSTTYIVLSNRKDITFDEAWKAEFSSNSEDFFNPREAVIVGKRVFEQ